MTGFGLNGNVLDLPAECLTAPTRLHVATLEAVMLWPHDEKAREIALHTSSVEFLKLVPDRSNLDFGFDLFEYAASAQPIATITEVAKVPFVHGVISGFILAETLGKSVLGVEGASIGRSIQLASETFWPQWRVSVKHINNFVWPHYRNVSPMWAACWMRSMGQKHPPFPCSALELIDFLAEADAFRRLGEAVRTFKSPAPVLPSGKAVQPPFSLPIVEIEFATKIET